MGAKPWDGLRIIRQPKGVLSHCVFKRGQRLLTFPHPRVRIGEHYTKEAGAYLKKERHKRQPHKPMTGQGNIEGRRI